MRSLSLSWNPSRRRAVLIEPSERVRLVHQLALKIVQSDPVMPSGVFVFRRAK